MLKEGLRLERTTRLGYHALTCRRVLAQMELRNVQSKGSNIKQIKFLINLYFKIFLEDSSDTPEKLNMDTMAFAFGLLIIGLLTGFLLFLFEFSCKKQDACLE